MKRLRYLLVLLITGAIFLFTSCQSTRLERFDSIFDCLTQNYGGQIITYAPRKDTEVPEMLLALYSRGNEAPDELKMVRSAKIWYGETPMGGDVAVFELFNATDGESVKKMCDRRAQTLKHSVHSDSTVLVDGHYVIYINEGNFEGLAKEFSPFLKKLDKNF